MSDTRSRILDAAWEIGQRDGVAALTLADVGRAAGVSRQAVYLHFANRAGLLLETARRFDHSSGFVARLAAARALPARPGIVAVLRLWFDYLPDILPVARALEAASVIGDDGAAAYLDRMNDWRESIRISVQALADAGQLRAGWSVDEAADWIWSLAHPSTFHHLVVERRWAPDAVADRTVSSVLAEVLTTTPAAEKGRQMAVELNHTIVAATDKRVSAEFLASILGLKVGAPYGPFLPVETENGVALDYMNTDPEHIHQQHYAFLVSEAEFDTIFDRIREAGLGFYADPGQRGVGEINRRDGGRGVYFDDPDGHVLEIITRPYGSGG